MVSYTRRLRPKGVPFLGSRYIRGYGFVISFVEVHERVGKSVIFC